MPKTVFTHKGYSVCKTSLSKQELLSLKKNLTVTPLAHPDYPPPLSFPVYSETDGWIRIPRNYGESIFGPAQVDLTKVFPIKLNYIGTLHPKQKIAFEKSLDHLRTKGAGLLCLSTGFGKTFIALALINALQVKTCILLHKTELLRQWEKEIRHWFPDVKICIIQGKSKEVDPTADVYLVMLQTLIRMETFPVQHSYLVLDECHHIPSETFSKSIYKVNAKYVLGLSATPNRKDGLTKVLTWSLGEAFHYEKETRTGLGLLVHQYLYSSQEIFDPKRYSETITRICNDHTRNNYILDIVLDLVDKDERNDRKVLILSERVSQAKFLAVELTKRQTAKSVGLYIGTKKKGELEQTIKADIVVATFSIFSEGISKVDLNTLVLASPKKDVVQALGRILRRPHLETAPMVLDVVDTTVFRGQAAARLRTFKSELKGNISVDKFEYPLITKCEKKTMPILESLLETNWSLL